MADQNTSTPANGSLLKWIAATSAAVYTVFVLVVQSGGSEASYQTTVWVSWAAITLVAAGTFGVGALLKGNIAEPAHSATDDQVPVLTSVG
ncbi:MAG: hypothetical protein DRJ28_05630 [Actinobacteria bacterium]|nr:MAG: hypothetical protein DRJ28_05630 [Actinomycetota bacterium]